MVFSKESAVRRLPAGPCEVPEHSAKADIMAVSEKRFASMHIVVFHLAEKACGKERRYSTVHLMLESV